MLGILRNSAAVMAATAALAAPVAAQTAPATTAPGAPAPSTTPAPVTPAAPTAPAPAEAPASPAPAAPAPDGTAQAASPAPSALNAAALPTALTDLGISEATLSDARKGGQRVEGKLPGGTAFRGMIDTDGKLRMIRTEGGAPLPEDIVRRMVPEPVRNAPVYPEFSRLEGMATHDRGVMLFGADATGEMLRAQFDVDGKLSRFGRGEPEGRRGDARGKYGKMDDHGRDGGNDRKGGKNRGDDDRHKGRDRGEDGAGRHDQNRDPSRDAAGQGAQTPLDDAAVRTILTDAGYTGLGAITRDGERVDVEAINRTGQPVTVTIGPRGVVVRELAR